MSTLGTLFIVSAPSGVGKTSLVNMLGKRTDNITKAISYTTRPIRSGEQDGLDYKFVTTETFQEMIEQDVFLEYAKVFGNFYGTPKTWVANTLSNGIDVVLVIDWQGAIQIRKKMTDIVSIFILPPSMMTLRKRLQKRGQDDLQVINNRLQQAQSEISHYNEYDYIVINDHFDKALKDLITIIHAQRLARRTQEVALQQLLVELQT